MSKKKKQTVREFVREARKQGRDSLGIFSDTEALEVLCKRQKETRQKGKKPLLEKDITRKDERAIIGISILRAESTADTVWTMSKNTLIKKQNTVQVFWFADGYTIREMLKECFANLKKSEKETLMPLLKEIEDAEEKKLNKLAEKIMFILGNGLRIDANLQREWQICVLSYNYDKRNKVGIPERNEEKIAEAKNLKSAIVEALKNIKTGKVKSRDEYVEKVLFKPLSEKNKEDKK